MTFILSVRPASKSIKSAQTSPEKDLGFEDAEDAIYSG